MPSVVYIVGEYPSRTETFIHGEIKKLRERGIDILVLSLKHMRLRKPYDANEPCSLFFNIRLLLLLPIIQILTFLKHHQVYSNLLKESFGKPGIETLRELKYLFLASYFAHTLRKLNIYHIHAHFINITSHVGIRLSLLTQKPFSCTAHANDIFLSSKESINKIFSHSKFMITCTAFNKQYLESRLTNADPQKLIHIYHGIDLNNLVKKKTIQSASIDNQVRILSIGRLVPKKGYNILLKALKMIKNEQIQFQCTIIGNGHLKKTIVDYIKNASLTESVSVINSLPHEQLSKFYQASDIFILPCLETNEGDMDGLPNVLLEAMAAGVPIISSNISAIPELIQNSYNGILVPSGDVVALKDAIVRLYKDKELQINLANNGLIEIKKFCIEKSIERIEGLFRKIGEDTP